MMRRTASTTFRLAGTASVLTLTSLMAASPVHAAATSASITDTMQHFIECAGWLITDPAKHAKECDPGHTVFANGTGGDGSTPDTED